MAERRRRIREAHPVAGGLILALTDEPRSTTAWARGAAGERRVGAVLDGLADEGVAVLHDRHVRGQRANIDHLAVAPSGVWVVDAKAYRGRLSRRDVGGWFATDVRVLVGRRDVTDLVTAMQRQVDMVRAALGPAGADVPVHPVLCFVDAEWGRLARPFAIGDVTVAWPRATARLIRRPGPLGPNRVAFLASTLDAALPPAP